jgi:galacturonokinase
MDEIKKFFAAKYPDRKMKIVNSPLRVCPLGAHIDHQHGLVTGFALQASIHMAYCDNKDGYVCIQSLDFPDEEYFHIDEVPKMIPGFWGNYVRGAVASLSKDFKLRIGLDSLISGKIPIGGLSSSAAVTTSYLMALCDVNGIRLTNEELIKYSHWVETDFIGLKNGILDQSANLLSKDGCLMFMDCRSGHYELIEKSKNMPEYEIVVVYSGLSKALIGTDYNNRVNECKVAAWILKEAACERVGTLEEARLRDIKPESYEKYKNLLPGRFKKRAEHFYSENERVLRGVQAWKDGDIEAFGRLIFESGESSVHNYECGCPELISIFGILKDCPGVYGARFSGAGYRGCCIGIVNPAYKDEIKKRIDSAYPILHPEYKDKYSVYFCKTGNSAEILEQEDSL